MDIWILIGVIVIIGLVFKGISLKEEGLSFDGCGCFGLVIIGLVLIGFVFIIFTILIGSDDGGSDSDGSDLNVPEYIDEDENPGIHWVEPYERSDGTEVDGYWRSNPDESEWNNLNP